MKIFDVFKYVGGKKLKYLQQIGLGGMLTKKVNYHANPN